MGKNILDTRKLYIPVIINLQLLVFYVLGWTEAVSKGLVQVTDNIKCRNPETQG